MKKIRSIINNTKESWAICRPLLHNRETVKKEKVEALFLGVFGGVLWTWITHGLKEQEKKWHERSE